MIGPAGFMSCPKASETLASLDEKGRCCGRKPMHYKGGSWRSPPGAPFLWCDRCDKLFDPETGIERKRGTPQRSDQS